MLSFHLMEKHKFFLNPSLDYNRLKHLNSLLQINLGLIGLWTPVLGSFWSFIKGFFVQNDNYQKTFNLYNL